MVDSIDDSAFAFVLGWAAVCLMVYHLLPPDRMVFRNQFDINSDYFVIGETKEIANSCQNGFHNLNLNHGIVLHKIKGEYSSCQSFGQRVCNSVTYRFNIRSSMHFPETITQDKVLLIV